MNVSNKITFEEGCKEYLDSCRVRNLRNGTIKHYVDTINQLYKYIDREMPIEDLTIKTFYQFMMTLRDNDSMNDTILYTYGRDLKTLFYFL